MLVPTVQATVQYAQPSHHVQRGLDPAGSGRRPRHRPRAPRCRPWLDRWRIALSRRREVHSNAAKRISCCRTNGASCSTHEAGLRAARGAARGPLRPQPALETGRNAFDVIAVCQVPWESFFGLLPDYLSASSRVQCVPGNSPSSFFSAYLECFEGSNGDAIHRRPRRGSGAGGLFN